MKRHIVIEGTLLGARELDDDEGTVLTFGNEDVTVPAIHGYALATTAYCLHCRVVIEVMEPQPANNYPEIEQERDAFVRVLQADRDTVSARYAALLDVLRTHVEGLPMDLSAFPPDDRRVIVEAIHALEYKGVDASRYVLRAEVQTMLMGAVADAEEAASNTANSAEDRAVWAKLSTALLALAATKVGGRAETPASESDPAKYILRSAVANRLLNAARAQDDIIAQDGIPDRYAHREASNVLHNLHDFYACPKEST